MTTFPDRPASVTARPASHVVGHLADEMVSRWRNGERPAVEEFLDRHPDLWGRPDLALELVAEEVALRDEYGEPATAGELARRFPRWAAQAAALIDCQKALGPRLAPPSFPDAGSSLGEFDLVSELGRGVHGRVYLARQRLLGGRPVVLKVSAEAGDEHLSLARLQHSHIVPLYSCHEFPDRRLRGLCLPYFGGATLADVRSHFGPWTGGIPAGRDFLPPLRPADPESSEPDRGPARRFLERSTLADAVAWVGAALADALQYAHDRGLLHLDVKPANVLLASDGAPMLLDFHLARPPLAAGDPPPGWLGGTPAYMAPEHKAAVTAVRDQTCVSVDVDGRADVFALGVLLAELLRGPGVDDPPAALPTGMRDILAKATAEDADDRYPTAADLAADLRRHLADLPLAGVRNRSARERWAKWRRRRPLAFPLLLVLAAVGAGAVAAAAHAGRLADRATAALKHGKAHAAAGRFAEAAEAFKGGEALAAGLPFRDRLRADLANARRSAERGRAAADLHAVCERVRPVYAAEGALGDQLHACESLCRELWARRDQFAAALAGLPTTEADERFRADLLDLAVLTADLRVRTAPPGDAAAKRAALDTLDQAERLLGPSAVLVLERTRHSAAKSAPAAPAGER